MIRFSLATLLLMITIVAVAAQGVVWNPNSSRGRRDLQANPPPPKQLPGQLGETIEAERWGTLSKSYREPQWGTIGGSGWTGPTHEAGQATR